MGVSLTSPPSGRSNSRMPAPRNTGTKNTASTVAEIMPPVQLSAVASITPLASAAFAMFQQASNMGHGREDDSAVIKTFSGITLPEGKA